MKLHLGCFDRPVEGWINTDITPHIWISRVPLLPAVLHSIGVLSSERLDQHRAGIFRQIRYLNLKKRFPFPDNRLEAVFSSHVIEHLYADEARACLAEVYRTLQEGGICRVSVPDLDAIVAKYSSEAPEPFLTAIFEKSKRSKNAHHWHYSEASLRALMQSVGFRQAYRCEFRRGRCPDIELMDNRPDVSLFVEAIK